MPEISLKGLSVVIGMPVSRDMNPFVVRSMLATQQMCMKHGIPMSFAIINGNAVIQWARDEVVDLFLDSDATRLFWIDSDIIWEPEDFMTQLALSQIEDVVCASYPAKKDPPTYYIHYDENKPLVMNEYGLVEILGAGLGFTVMKREVVERVAEQADKIKDEISGKEIASIFEIGSTGGKRHGEDMHFFNQVRALGYSVHLNPAIQLGHTGVKTYTGDLLNTLEISNYKEKAA